MQTIGCLVNKEVHYHADGKDQGVGGRMLLILHYLCKKSGKISAKRGVGLYYIMGIFYGIPYSRYFSRDGIFVEALEVVLRE